MTKFGPKLAFLVILGQALPAHLVPCWWVGWLLCRAGCISQDTYFLYVVAAANIATAKSLKPKDMVHLQSANMIHLHTTSDVQLQNTT